MDERDTFNGLAHEAVNGQDVDAVVRLVEDLAFPFWLRREGLEIAMESPEDEFAITVFNRLFRPVAKASDGETLLLLEWWLNREARVAALRRLTYLRPFLLEAAGIPCLPDRLNNAILGVHSACTQRANSLSGWCEANQVTKRFLETFRETAPSRLVDPRMLRAALWSGDLGLMSAFADVGVKAAETSDQRLMVHYIVGNLVTFADRIELRPLAQAMHGRDPRHPIAIHNLAQVYDAECRDTAEIADLYLCIDEQLDPDRFGSTVDWIAQVCYDRGLKDRAASLFAMLPAMPANRARDMSWPQRVLQDKFAAAAGTPPVDVSLLDLAGLPPVLAQPLEQAAHLAQDDMSWDASLTAAALEQAFRGIIGRIGAIPPTAPFLTDCVRATHRMVRLARKYFEPYRHYVDVSPVPLANKYGRIDMERLRAAYVGLMSVAAATAAIGLEVILDGAPLRDMETCLRLLDYYVDARLAAGAPNEALAMLERFLSVEACRDFARRLVEQCLLVKGETCLATALLAPDERRRSVIYDVVDREHWNRAEELAWDIVVDDPQCHGQFDVAWVDGSVCSYDHVVPPVRLAKAKPETLIVRRGEILRGRTDLILRPERLHYPLGYPRHTPDVVARGDKAVRLLRLAPPRKITEPLVVLENFDALHHRNYYHWIVLLLTRLNHVRALGLLEGRRLVVPEGLSAWMQESCHAIGVSADDILIVPPDVELRVTDALLISSVEFASPVLLQSLCATLLLPSVADEMDAPRYLYLSRLNQTRRPFLNELEIEAIARNLGFTIIQPETLPFVEQARLFARADGVAGSEGAAFANTIFCRPGVRILTMLNENDLFPTYNDIATSMNLRHRKLTGKAELDDYGVSYLWAPFRIDPKLAERQLCWVLGD
jgi:hypothetical protein